MSDSDPIPTVAGGELPDLPEPALFAPQMVTEDAYTAAQLREAQREAVEMDRARRLDPEAPAQAAEQLLLELMRGLEIGGDAETWTPEQLFMVGRAIADQAKSAAQAEPLTDCATQMPGTATPGADTTAPRASGDGGTSDVAHCTLGVVTHGVVAIGPAQAEKSDSRKQTDATATDIPQAENDARDAT